MRPIRLQLLIIILAGFCFFPFLVKAQETVDIIVSATVASTSTPPVEFCGDNICNNSETCSTCPQDCGICGGGGGGTVVIPENNKVVFIGKAYPFAVLTISKNNSIIAVFKAEETGLFQKEISGIAAGNYNFAIFAEDSKGRKSVTTGFTVGILNQKTTTISGIFLSPTIELGPTQIEVGQTVNIMGQSFPESQVNIFVASNETIKEAFSDNLGKWSYELDTSQMSIEQHSAKAKAIAQEGEQSPFSQTISFLVVKKGGMVCKGADLNFDDKVNLTDFSILLFYWGQKKPENICADINQDGIVDLVDFSIMMYYWTK